MNGEGRGLSSPPPILLALVPLANPAEPLADTRSRQPTQSPPPTRSAEDWRARECEYELRREEELRPLPRIVLALVPLANPAEPLADTQSLQPTRSPPPTRSAEDRRVRECEYERRRERTSQSPANRTRTRWQARGGRRGLDWFWYRTQRVTVRKWRSLRQQLLRFLLADSAQAFAAAPGAPRVREICVRPGQVSAEFASPGSPVSLVGRLRTHPRRHTPRRQSEDARRAKAQLAKRFTSCHCPAPLSQRGSQPISDNR